MPLKKSSLLVSLTSLLFLLTVFSLINVKVLSAVTPAVYVNPSRIASVTWTPSKQFNISINVADVNDLFAWEVYLSWNSSLLRFVTWFEGPFLKAQPQGTFIGEDINQTEHPGSVMIGVTTVGEYIGKSGSGVLAYVTMQVKELGSSTLNLHNTTLLDSAWRGQPKPENLIPHTERDGFFVNLGVPEALFTYSPNKPAANTAVTFNASASYDSDGYIVSYAWDFGDGTLLNTTEKVATHTYLIVGSYTVVLNVTDNTGLTNTATQSINIRWQHDVAVISVTSNPLSVKAGEAIKITVVVKNLGAETETFDVRVFYADTELGKQTVTNLAPDATQTLTFTWDTSGMAVGDYVIKAVAQTVSGETSTTDNLRVDGTVGVQPAEQQFPIMLVIGGGAGAVAVAGIAFFLFRRRNKGVQVVTAASSSS